METFFLNFLGVEWPDKDKSSVAATLSVVVSPVNDAVPRLVNNTGLTMWAGSTVPITPAHLAAVDDDTK
jgi:hypothetical protein